MSDKEDLRRVMRVKRRYFQSVRRSAADDMICENFVAAFIKYDSFLMYADKGDEATTELIIAQLLASGKRVFLPRVEGENIVAVPYGALHRGAFRVMEPDGQPYDGAIDVTVVPLLAVNERGFRLGYGGGYYDRYLSRADTLKVGLGYFFQLGNFAEDEWDVPVEYFLCERGIYDFGKHNDG